MKTGTNSEIKDTAETEASQLDAAETKTPPFSNYQVGHHHVIDDLA